MLAGAKFQRRIFEIEPLSRSILGEYLPGKDVRTDQEWRAYILQNAMSAYHPAGTCKMGQGPMAVVDKELRVRGVEGLFIADASIMPLIVSGNLNATCIMIGEKAADLIKALG